MSDVRRATIRDRRQVTLPADVCRQLGLEVGDSVAVELENGGIRLTPSHKRALDALEAVRRAFQESGVTEADLQETAKRVRKELVRERYGPKFASD